MARTKSRKPETVALENLSDEEKSLIVAMRKIPAENGERFYRTMSVVTIVNALADGMRAARG
jgi:hypothetical protein